MSSTINIGEAAAAVEVAAAAAAMVAAATATLAEKAVAATGSVAGWDLGVHYTTPSHSEIIFKNSGK